MLLKVDRTNEQKWPKQLKNNKKLDTVYDTETSQPKAIKKHQTKKETVGKQRTKNYRKQKTEEGACSAVTRNKHSYLQATCDV
jgi:hypothetical protein